MHQRLPGPRVHTRRPLDADRHRAHPLAPAPEQQTRLVLFPGDAQLDVDALGRRGVFAADHDDLVGVAHPAPHAGLPAIRHRPRFRAGYDGKARPAALRLVGEPIAEIAVVIDVVAEKHPDAGGRNHSRSLTDRSERRSDTKCCSLRVSQASLYRTRFEFRLSLKTGMVRLKQPREQGAPVANLPTRAVGRSQSSVVLWDVRRLSYGDEQKLGPRSSQLKKIYVGNLPFSTTDDDLRDLFARHGEVSSASVVMDRESGRSRGFGFVEMETANADTAITALNGRDVGGRSLRVNEAESRGR